jgi:fumarate reductase subunit C
MSLPRPAPRSHVRPMAGWWRKNPYFMRYMVREGSAVFLSAYALVLLVGLWRLSQGEAAFEAWRAALATPLSLGLHALALLIVCYHAFTWFQVMPKTAPRLPVAPRLITAAGLVLSALLSVLILLVLLWAGR